MPRVAVLRPAILVCTVIALLSGCASRGVMLSSASLWPFQSLEIGTAAGGIVTGYFYLPPTKPRRLVVVLQEPLCRSPQAALAEESSISTGGVLWEQFAKDSAFLQFEAPVAVAPTSMDASAKDPACDRAESWVRAASEAIDAVREREGLAAVPTMYLGIDEGALPAIGLTIGDRRATALVLISAHVPEAWALRVRAPVVIAHGYLDEKTPIEAANSLYSSLNRSGRPVSLLGFRQLGRDLGLSSGRPECFEVAMRMLAQRAMQVADAGGRRLDGRTEVDCPDTESAAASSDAQVIQALP